MERDRILAPHSSRFSFDDPVFGNPELADDCYISSSAKIIGHVITQSGVIVCPLAVIRADEGMHFHIGKGTNIQDHCCLHGHKDRFVKGDDDKEYSIYIGSHCTFAHGSKGHGPLKVGKKTFVGFDAILHCSNIGRNCYIDHRAVVKRSTIGNNCHIGIGAIVEGVTIDDRRFVAPGQVITHPREASRLPPVPKEIAEEDNLTNKSIVDENKCLCVQYHQRRLDLLSQRSR